MAKKLWGGRFAKATDKMVEIFTESISYDHKLAECDLIGSKIQVDVLKEAGYLTVPETAKFKTAIDKILSKIDKGTFKFDMKAEDIHSDMQNAIEKEVGGLIAKLHTARSRNDQVLLDLKMYTKLELGRLISLSSELEDAFVNAGKSVKGVVIPGYTHLQHAQLVYLADHLMVYAKMIANDKERFECINSSISISFGAGAFAGTPIKKDVYIKVLKKYFGTGEISPASAIYTVSDRDFVIETLSAISIMGMHLSRFAEEIILWSSKEFSFVELDDAYATGSSLMPQKKNPDVLELARGYTGTLYGNLMSVLVMMKGLPLTYNRDMQLDKPALFSSLDIIEKELMVLPGLIETLKWNKKVIRETIEKDETLYATDLLYYLVGKGLAFKDAHDVIGELVKYSLNSGRKITDMKDAELLQFSGKLKHNEIAKLMDPVVSVRSRVSVER